MERARERDFVISAFKEGNKIIAKQLSFYILQPAAITTTFQFWSILRPVSKVSLLHLAAFWGWEDLVTELVSVYGCSIVCRDEEEHIPLHYAAYN